MLIGWAHKPVVVELVKSIGDTLTPCIRQCKVDNGVCVSCGRTLQMIKDWRDMSNEDRMEAMQSLKASLVTHPCPVCNAPTYCAMNAGKSGSSCWCMTVAVADKPEIYEEGDCLCKKCLTTQFR